jgi:hypothetical protein
MNETVEGLLQIEQLPIVGLLLGIIAILIYFIISLRKELKEKDKELDVLHEKRLQEQKDFNKDMLDLSARVTNYISQLQDILKVRE